MVIDNFLSRDFPVHCTDDPKLVYACDQGRLKEVFYADKGIKYDEIWEYPDEQKLFSLIEFLYVHSSEPIQLRQHPFFNHEDINKFSVQSGCEKFTNGINDIFKNVKAPFQLISGRVTNAVNEIFETIVDKNIFNTGDKTTDELLKSSVNLFKDTSNANKKRALEDLWKSWERIKTLENANKKTGLEKILKEAVPSNELRKEIEKDAMSLTEIGNHFQIRHYENSSIPIRDEDMDYLYFRLYNLIYKILLGTNRISHET